MHIKMKYIDKVLNNNLVYGQKSAAKGSSRSNRPYELRQKEKSQFAGAVNCEQMSRSSGNFHNFTKDIFMCFEYPHL